MEYLHWLLYIFQRQINILNNLSLKAEVVKWYLSYLWFVNFEIIYYSSINWQFYLHGTISNGFNSAIKVGRLSFMDIDILDFADKNWSLSHNFINHISVMPFPFPFLQVPQTVSARFEASWKLRIHINAFLAFDLNSALCWGFTMFVNSLKRWRIVFLSFWIGTHVLNV